MFWFRKRKPTVPPPLPVTPPPPPDPGPMEAVAGTVAFANGERSWTETFHVADTLEQVLTRQEFYLTRDGNTVRLTESGYEIAPVLISFQPLDRGGAQTVTVTRVRHPTLIPGGLFEYQHSTGDSMADALAKGFDQWAQTDLAALLDALEEKPNRCTRMEMSFPATPDGRPARDRRVILGPVSHLLVPRPTSPAAAEEEHPFCPCCLLTRSFEAFKDQLQGEGTFGLRLFAMRNADGSTAADCRVNGEEYEPGKAALRRYVDTWPPGGVEFRKQYVVVRSA